MSKIRRYLVKALLKLFLVLAVLCSLAVPAMADTDIGVSGQIRLRIETDEKDFGDSITTLNFADMRSRMVLEAIVDNNAHVFIQYQDSRRAGDDDLSGTTINGKNGDVHQAWLKVDNLFGKGWGAKGGKFEFILGNERVFGAVGWSNVGRSWQGLMFWYDNPKAKIMPFWLKRLELNDPGYNRDFDIFGILALVKDLNWESFAVYEYNADSTGLTRNKLGRFTLGTYYKREHQKFDFELNAALQAGDMATFGNEIISVDTILWGIDTTFVNHYNPLELDISAYMFTLEVGYQVCSKKNGRVAVGVDFTSGDSNTDDNKHKTYDNLYNTGHKFNGYMDYFTASKLTGKPYEKAGLIDLMLRGGLDVIRGWKAKCDIHYFMTAQEYSYIGETDPNYTRDVGFEFDLTVSTTRVAGVNLVAGASLFLPEDAFAGVPNPDPGFWSYWMATVDF
jgi:hypothetical protein